jgi:hypothetical protein
MALVLAPPPNYEPYRLDFDIRPRAVTPRRKTEIRFTVRHPQTSAAVTRFELVHERVLHLFILSHDLDYFAHVHPDQQPDGSFVYTAMFPRPGAYRLIAEFLPVGGAPQLIQHSVVTAGYAGSLLPTAELSQDVADKVVDGVRVKLTMPEPVGGREQLVTFDLTDAVTGRPVSDLEPFLGATGHLLLVSADLQTAAHSHPVAEMSAVVGPTVVFQMLFPRAGRYRFWVQFQRKGRILTAPFTVSARPRDPIFGR